MQNTSSDAMSFWAGKALEFKALVNDLDSLLPPINGDGDPAISEDSKDAVIEAFQEAQLAAEIVLGGYTRQRFAEQSAAQQHANGQAQVARG